MPPTETPEARRHALAFNAVGAALRPYGEYLRLSIREDIARSVVAALDDDAQAEAQRRSTEPGRVVLHIEAAGAGREFRQLLRDVVRMETPVTPAEPDEPTQDSTGWAWTCHHDACPHGQEGFWTRWGARRARDRHLNTHGADHA